MPSFIEQTEKAAGDHSSAIQPESCPTCGAEFLGPFCHACGEKRIFSNDLNLRNYAKTLLVP